MGRLGILLFTGFVVGAPALAEPSGPTSDDELVSSIISAYGGAALKALSSLAIRDRGLYSEHSYGFTPSFSEYDTSDSLLELDLAGQRGSYDYRVAGDRFGYHNRIVTQDESIANVSYGLGTFEPRAYPSFLSAFGASMRRSDTLIAYWIAHQPNDLKKTGTSRYLGRDHITVDFSLPGAGSALLHIDARTFHISRMDRAWGGDQTLTYLWSNHQSKGGITYGAFFQQHYNDHLERVVREREIEFGFLRSDPFVIDRRIQQEPKRRDASSASHLRLAEGVFLTGLDGAFSIFALDADGVVAVGTTAGLQERFRLFQEKLGSTASLQYVISTQHAAPHLEGISDAYALGATIVMPEPHAAAIETALGKRPEADRILWQVDNQQIGPFRIFDTTTTHSDHAPVVYISKARALFQADTYAGEYEAAPGFAGSGAVALKSEIERLGLSIDKVLSPFSPHPSPYQDFLAAVDAYSKNPCWDTSPLCQP